MRHSHLGTLALISLLTACDNGPGLAATYEIEHLRIGTDLDHPLCAGDLAAYEAILRRTEAELGISMQSKFSVSIWSDEAWKTARPQYCGSGALGCTSYQEDAIYTSWSSVEHELGHAAVPIPNLTPFFAEGLADVYAGRQSRFGVTTPSDSLALSAEDMDRSMARHFVRWLRETWGGAKLGELARLGKRAGKGFDDVYGLSFAEAEAMFFAEAPFGYPGLDTCGGAPLDVAEDLGGWRAVVDLDCGAGEDVRVYGIGVITRRVFDIPVAGHYSVSTDADALTLSRCATGPIEAPIRYDEFDGDDVPPSYAGHFMEEYAFYEGGPILDLYFEAGKHEIGLLLMGYEAGEVAVSIWPSVGPQPVEGGH